MTSKKIEYAWLRSITVDQAKAYITLVVVSFMVSLLMLLIFYQLGGDNLADNYFWTSVGFIFIFPLIVFAKKWAVVILPQYEAELVIFSVRQQVWFTENFYIIPFYGWIIKFNERKIVKTSRSDETKAFHFFTQDKNGEILEVEIDAERKIINPTKYEEFNDAGMVIDEVQLLKNAAIRSIIDLDFKTQIAGKKVEIDDADFKSKCSDFGINFKPIIVTARLADPSSDSLNAKYARLIKAHTDEYRVLTGKAPTDPLTLEEIEKIKEDVEMILKLPTSKAIYEGLSGVKPILPLKPTK